MSALIDAYTNGKDNFTVRKIIRAYKIEPPCKFWVGDTVYFSPETRNFVIDKYGTTGGWDPQADEFIDEYKNKSEPFEVIGITKYKEDADSLWWFLCRCYDSTVWFSQESLLPSESSIPNYKPRIIDRTLESNNDINTAREICIEIENMEDFDKINRICESLDYRIGFVPRGFPHFLFIDLKYKSSSFVNAGDRDIMNVTDENDPRYVLNNVYKKRYTIDDLDNIILMLKTGKIIDTPNYRPKKMNKVLEAKNRASEAKEIMILIRNIDELNTLYDTIKPMGYTIVEPFFKVMRESETPINIFIDLETGDITQSTHMKSYDDWTKISTFDGVWERELTIEELPLIKRILETKKIIVEPSYKPRTIKKIEEKMGIPHYMPDEPPILTPEEQKDLYKVGDIVIVRPDAFSYFGDVDTYEMKHYFGKKVKIIGRMTAREHYGDDEDSDLVKADDLLITVVSADESYQSTDRWYWHYRCLFSPKTMKPSYKPRKMDRNIFESVDMSHIPSVPPILSDAQQRQQYKEGDVVYIRPDAFDYFFDTNDEMKKWLGEYGEITYVTIAEDIYGMSTEKGKEMKTDDLILTLRLVDSPEDSDTYYWFYRCLINPKFAIPSYKPKHIDRTVEESFREDYHINPEKYQERFGRISPIIVSIEEIEEFYGVKFESYCNDLGFNQ